MFRGENNNSLLHDNKKANIIIIRNIFRTLMNYTFASNNDIRWQ